MMPNNRPVFVRVQASGHYFVLLFLPGLEQQVYQQVFLWAFDPKLPAFTWLEADKLLHAMELLATIGDVQKRG